MSSVSGLLQKKDYFIIVDKDDQHPHKPYYDVVCYELLKDNPVYHELTYLDMPFFTGLVLFDTDPTTAQLVPFKFWKRNLTAENEEDRLKNIDPTNFRLFVINAIFLVVGNQLNRPQGHELDQYQVVEAESAEVQKLQMKEYLKDLLPVYEYCKSVQYDKIRNYLFCHTCKSEKKYTLLDEKTRFKSQAFFVCRDCAGREVVQFLKKTLEITPALKAYVRDLVMEYRDVNKTINVFSPNFNILEHREATLVGTKKVQITFKRPKPVTIYDIDLPAPLIKYFEEQERTELLPAQIMAVEHGLMENQDLLIVSATSSGKTMIGELAGISKILREKLASTFPLQNEPDLTPESPESKTNSQRSQTSEAQKQWQQLRSIRSRSRMLYLVPIVALANMRFREYKELERFGINSALKVGVSYISRKGVDKDEFGKFNTADVIVATYEAIDILLRSGHPYLLRDIKTVIVDEIQMLADPERGFTLDGLIARLRLVLPRTQRLYLSATISDPQNLAKSLRADLIKYEDRPVPIERHMVMCMSDQAKEKNIRLLVQAEFKNTSSFGFKGQSIVFTNSRKNAERLADFLEFNHIRANAYHGGLDYWQRKLIEKAFSMQKIACVVTTAALAAGVDFPASQVIFYNLTMGIKGLTVAEFEQMSGRAGRLNKHDIGRVYLLIQPGKTYVGTQSETEEQMAVRMLQGKIEPLALVPNEDAQYSQVLATIAMSTYPNNQDHGITQDNLTYFHLMLFNGNFDLRFAIASLVENKMARKIQNNTELQATKFGKAVAESFFSLEQAKQIRDALTTEVTETHPPPEMLALAQTLHEFNNVYVTNRIISEMSVKNQRQSRSNNLFSNSVLDLIKSDHLGKKHGHTSQRLYEVLIKWSEEIFNCTCQESPFCDCPRRNIEHYILDYRMQGLSILDIIDFFQDEYEIQFFQGDLVDYLEATIYSLLSIEKFGTALPVPAQTMLKVREIPRIVAQLIGPRKAKSRSKVAKQEESEEVSEEDEGSESEDQMD